MSRSELDLAVSIRKAISPEETAPKRKHVRSCIVYSWDHKSSAAFWQALKVQPLLSDEVQTFKALICIHKILQEGHPVCLRDAQNQSSWIDSLGRSFLGDGIRGYGVLIREYSSFLLSKLKFHRQHPEFNGTFEYEEYVTLKTTLDPNEGYETTSNLMALQDQINSFQKLVFSHFRQSISNECKISALVPLVQESYGIYRFITSMLRAMFQANELVDVLEPLEKKYIAQFHRLASFYYECSNLKYLSRLIALPKLPENPVDLRKQQDAVYVGSQPVENSDEVGEKDAHDTDPLGITTSVSLDPDNLQPFWESAFTTLTENRSSFEPMANMQFLPAEVGPSTSNFSPAMLPVISTTSPPMSMHNEGVIQNYENRIEELETAITHIQNSAAASSSSVQSSLEQATSRAELWASKYESLAQLYTRLRKEHLGTIEKAKILDSKLKDYSHLTQRCKAYEKTIQEKTVLLLNAEREKEKALSRLKTLQEIPAGTKEPARSSIAMVESLGQQLQEKEEEIAIMKEAFEQSLAQINDSLKAKDGLEATLRNIIEIILKFCTFHIKEAALVLGPSSLNASMESVAELAQVIEESMVLLTHLGEVVGSTSFDLVMENCLQLSHTIGLLIAYSQIFVKDLDGDDKHRFESMVTYVSSNFEILFNEMAASMSLARLGFSVNPEHIDSLKAKLDSLSTFINSTSRNGLPTGSTDELSNKEDFQTALERAAIAKESAERLQGNLGMAQYSNFEIALSSNIVQLAMNITNAVANLLDIAAKSEEELPSSHNIQTKKAYNSSERWSNGFVSASKAVAGAVSVLISVADGVLRAQNETEQLEVATQNVMSSTKQLVLAARVRLGTTSVLKFDLENAAAQVISSCRMLNSRVHDSMESVKAMKTAKKLTAYELKVAQMDQQVEIVQLEIALQAARSKLGELRKLSYASSD